jgi:tetratricopeptide (TPR) repeat protein
MKITKNRWKNNKQAMEYLIKISNYFGNLPLAITLAGNDLDYSEMHPKDYYEDLELFGIDLKYIYNDDERIKSEKTNIKLLLDRAFGLSEDIKTIHLSYNAKNLLGLIGCLNSSFLPVEFFNVIGMTKQDCLKAILELYNYGLIGFYNKREILYPKHALIYNYARDNAHKLLTEISMLYNILTLICYYFVQVYAGKELFDNSNNLYVTLELHLYHALKMAIKLTKEFSEDFQNTISIGCLILARSGLYDEFIEIKKMLEDINSFDFKRFEFVSAYSDYLIGVNDYANLIKLNEEICNYRKDKFGSMSYDYLISYISLGYYYQLNKDFEKAFTIAKECYEILLTQKDLEGYDDYLLVINTNIAEASIGLGKYEDAETLLMSCLKDNRLNNITSDSTLDAELVLAKAFFKNSKMQEGLALLEDCYNKRVKGFTLRDTRTLETLNEIGELFMEIGDFEVPQKIYPDLIYETIRIFGNDHIITKKYINNFQLCQSKCTP